MKNNTRQESSRATTGGLSRRAFITGALIAGAGATASLTACQPSTSAGEGSGTSPSATGGTNAGTGVINAQDDSYTTYTTDYAALFSPLQIGGITLPNRIAKSAAGSETLFLAHTYIPSAATAFYENMAIGGVGMIWVESGDPSPDGSGMEKSIGREEDIGYWTPFVETIHSHGGYCGMQLTGNYSKFSSSKTLPSALDNNNTANVPMTTEEVAAYIQTWIAGAVNLQRMGFDGVEINASCSHTLDSFLSRFWNTSREDQYGSQSLENRARIVTEMIEGMRERCGQDFVIQVLFNGIEENIVNLGDSSLCIKRAEAVGLAKLFEAAGASSLHVRSSLFGDHASGFMVDLIHVPVAGHTGFGTIADFSQHMDNRWNGQWDGAASLLKIATEIKHNVSIPVGFVGCADPRLAPDLINDAIANGDIDFVLMTRALMADPALPNKLKEGRRDEVAPCVHCLSCFSGGKDFTMPVQCRVNATITRAYSEEMPEGTVPIPAAETKKVMVVGAGPAGMEAARIAAERGHRVTLYEKNGSLGGLLTFASIVKGPHEKIADHLAYLTRQLELTGVEVVTGQEVDADFIRAQAPDAVVVATGGLRDMITAPGSDLPHVCSIENYASMDIGEKVTIVVGNFQAVDFAMYLVKEGKKVTMVFEAPAAALGDKSPIFPKLSNLGWIRAQGVQVYDSSRLVGIDEAEVTIETGYGTTVKVPADTVVSCIEMLPNEGLAAALDASIQVITIGDALEPSTILHAVATGNVAGRQISPADVPYDPTAKMSGEQTGMGFAPPEGMDPSALPPMP